MAVLLVDIPGIEPGTSKTKKYELLLELKLQNLEGEGAGNSYPLWISPVGYTHQWVAFVAEVHNSWDRLFFLALSFCHSLGGIATTEEACILEMHVGCSHLWLPAIVGHYFTFLGKGALWVLTI